MTILIKSRHFQTWRPARSIHNSSYNFFSLFVVGLFFYDSRHCHFASIEKLFATFINLDRVEYGNSENLHNLWKFEACFCFSSFSTLFQTFSHWKLYSLSQLSALWDDTKHSDFWYSLLFMQFYSPFYIYFYVLDANLKKFSCVFFLL